MHKQRTIYILFFIKEKPWLLWSLADNNYHFIFNKNILDNRNFINIAKEVKLLIHYSRSNVWH